MIRALAWIVVLLWGIDTFGIAQDRETPKSHPRENGLWSSTQLESARSGIPTLWIASDSTAATGNATTRGWGAVLIDYFDSDRIQIINRAVGGRSFRSYTREGRWGQLLDAMKPGDFVLIEFGHNDGGGAKSPTGRGDVPGTGDETETVIGKDGQEEIVHSFGWYLRTYIRQARSQGATPIVCSTTVRNLWEEDRVERGMGQMREWAEQVASEEKALFIDHSNLSADHYEKIGRAQASRYHPQDHTHTNVEGAIANAESLIAGLRAHDEHGLLGYLNDRGRSIQPIAKQPHWRTFQPTRKPPSADATNQDSSAKEQESKDYGVDRKGRKLRYPPGVEPGMPHASYNPSLPTLWLIGDSTVKEGRDNGLNGGRWGWGHELDRYFDGSKINIENQALGGTSSRSFQTEGWWSSVLEMIRPGDGVLIQFGHNDGGIRSNTPRIKARGTLPGIGDDTLSMEIATGTSEVVHSYGWYLRKYIDDIRKAGATPIVCSPIPRNRWKEGKVERESNEGYAQWARQVAQATSTPFLDLHHAIADTMDAMGEDFAKQALFRSDDATHTNLLGAQINARCVVIELQGHSQLQDWKRFLSTSAPMTQP
ncbi:MAG: rhamnogalacturonan acetylesterase [Pirellulales bacterium]